jgi:hypothetical protein
MSTSPAAEKNWTKGSPERVLPAGRPVKTSV